jgi:hypothetical protein
MIAIPPTVMTHIMATMPTKKGMPNIIPKIILRVIITKAPLFFATTYKFRGA